MPFIWHFLMIFVNLVFRPLRRIKDSSEIYDQAEALKLSEYSKQRLGLATEQPIITKVVSVEYNYGFIDLLGNYFSMGDK